MRRTNLSTDQNKALVGLTIAERIELFRQWLEQGEISEAQYAYQVERQLKKSTKGERATLTKSRNVAEGRLNALIDDLKSRLRFVISEGDDFFKLKENELEEISFFLQVGQPVLKIDKLLIQGLRYPDKRLNSICFDYVRSNRMASEVFWTEVWNSDFIPSDVIRLMLDEKGEISTSFRREILHKLMPLIRSQYQQEVLRGWASQNNNLYKKSQKRLRLFNKFLEKLKKTGFR